MKTVEKSVLIWYSADEMYRLVVDVERYPQFLPWCDSTRVLDADELGMTAEIGLAIAGLRQTFSTRNTHVPGRSVHLELVQGPFSQLDGFWQFTPIGQAGERACRVSLTMCYGFDSAPLAAVVGPVFDKIAASLVDAFVKRAGAVYGGAP
ncbi:MAG TPA: type II toxin-antitoxin system RatA family toxin [Burkholderiaceae bacterium]|jgi:ribosome-associated toxin RatA of RatAB toxin-antitoxin module|nr:type II toxin-antitoxin system RatA family toxin [Burkholderiaceae bacterium]